MKLSVVIVNYNVEYFLEQCLLSVEKANRILEAAFGPGCAEVFVVDNRSADGSVQMVRDKFPWVHLTANAENVGFSRANNQAMRISSGEYILLLNPDTVVEDDTFLKVVRFMDEHPDAGGLGVKMLDGKGNFLPESKRGLPTPWVAFYKISGLARLFPRSQKFGRYHLGFFPPDETNEVDILSGAFMLMRKAALDKVGLLDEDFFMYGEDIDLSYRIQLGGYKNYYFPGTRIIHYKGESTKKSSVNYVFIFYRAMIIFARKHFKQRNARMFSLLIHMAIYLRAGLAIFNRFVRRAGLPMADAAVLFAGMYLLKLYWENNHKYVEGGTYPSAFLWIAVPLYIVVWLTGVYFSGGYDRPYRLGKIVRGVLWGTFFILAGYALLPEDYRFSRALILLGAAIASLALMSTRLAVHFIRYRNFNIESALKKRILIVGHPEECRRVESLIRSTHEKPEIIGYVTLAGNEPESIGVLSQLHDLVSIYSIQEVIFCGRDLSSADIMDHMSRLHHTDVDYKIAPPESEFIIGSNSINRMGELYVVDLNSVNRPANRRKKRVLDVSVAALFTVLLPLGLLIVRRPGKFISNLWNVWTGKMTWISYTPELGNKDTLPALKPGVLSPLDAVYTKVSDGKTVLHLNMLYAKDYHPSSDISILFKNLRKLGR